MDKKALIEKYRPTTLDDVVLSEETRNKFQEYISSNAIPNLLFVSPPGQGKTTCAKILAKEISDEILYINASSTPSIDVIREKVETFCATRSFSDV